MKLKTLATAITVSMPMILGTAYAQTTTTPDTGNNRAASGTSASTNQAPAASGTAGSAGVSSPGASTSPGAASSGATDASGTSGSSGTTGTSGSSGAMGSSSTSGAAGTPGAAGATAGAAAGASAPGTTPNSTMGGSAGAQTDSAATTEAITGWSAKDDIIGKSVHNENDEKVGDINDIVISSDGKTMYLLVGAGGFLGMGEKNVAVPFDRFERNEDRILLSGYTKEQLKALPEVRTER